MAAAGAAAAWDRGRRDSRGGRGNGTRGGTRGVGRGLEVCQIVDTVYRTVCQDVHTARLSTITHHPHNPIGNCLATLSQAFVLLTVVLMTEPHYV